MHSLVGFLKAHPTKCTHVYRTEPGKVSPLPAFYQQTRAAYLELAHAGGGSMKSLEGNTRSTSRS
jgi:hypothetical protein